MFRGGPNTELGSGNLKHTYIFLGPYTKILLVLLFSFRKSSSVHYTPSCLTTGSPSPYHLHVVLSLYIIYTHNGETGNRGELRYIGGSTQLYSSYYVNKLFSEYVNNFLLHFYTPFFLS